MLINQFDWGLLLVFFLIETICMESLSNLKSTTVDADRNGANDSNRIVTVTSPAGVRLPNEREKEFLIKLVAAIEQSPGPTFNETSSYNRSFRNTIVVLVSSIVVFVIVATLMIVKCWKNDRRQRAYKRAALGTDSMTVGGCASGAAATSSNCDNNEEMKTF